jgi:hypothetical protein
MNIPLPKQTQYCAGAYTAEHRTSQGRTLEKDVERTENERSVDEEKPASGEQ